MSAPPPPRPWAWGPEVAGGVASADGVTLQARGHSPCAKAARCPNTADVGHPQASPSGQMALLPSVAAFLGADLPEVQRAPEPHRQSLMRSSGNTGSAPARPVSFMCVGGVTQNILVSL